MIVWGVQNDSAHDVTTYNKSDRESSCSSRGYYYYCGCDR